MDIDIEGTYFQKLESKCKYAKHAETEKGREGEMVRERERDTERETDRRRGTSLKTATPGPNVVIHETSASLV